MGDAPAAAVIRDAAADWSILANVVACRLPVSVGECQPIGRRAFIYRAFSTSRDYLRLSIGLRIDGQLTSFVAPRSRCRLRSLAAG